LIGGGGFLGFILTTDDSTLGGGRKLCFDIWEYEAIIKGSAGRVWADGFALAFMLRTFIKCVVFERS